MSQKTAIQAKATQALINAAIYAASGAKNQHRSYGHGDIVTTMCIEDGYLGEPFASRLVAAVQAYQLAHQEV